MNTALLQVPTKNDLKIVLKAKPVEYGHIVLCLLYQGEFVTWWRDEEGFDHEDRYFQNLRTALKDYDSRS